MLNKTKISIFKIVYFLLGKYKRRFAMTENNLKSIDTIIRILKNEMP
jgi:hypothetical protein